MSDSPLTATPEGGIAVIDIGSNTVRMVIYDGFARVPFPLFNEKATCGLGRGIAVTGKLNQEGIELARKALTRFKKLVDILEVGQVSILATAAVRDAEDGMGFAEEVKDLFGIPVSVLSGAEEAELAAHGVACGVHNADGIVADMGGGSLDIIYIHGEAFGKWATLPLGHLRVQEASGGNQNKATDFIDEHLDPLGWLTESGNRTLYIVGGAWRAIGKAFIQMSQYPLNVIDNYSIKRRDAEPLLEEIIRMEPDQLLEFTSIPKRRSMALPLAGLVLKKMIDLARPEKLVFTAYSMREGKFLTTLPEKYRHDDPLLASSKRLVQTRGRFAEHGQELYDWMSPLFTDETEAEKRIRLATCLLSDISWFEHQDYRSEHAFRRIIRLPFAGLSHRERIMLAYSVSYRYDGEPKFFAGSGLGAVLDKKSVDRARVIGAALRLANTLCGGIPKILTKTELVLQQGKLDLLLPPDGVIYASDPVQRRVEALFETLQQEEANGG
ncbi:MAG: Ppx/GppA family phosphatase [Alphaproteobacteria bacterium]|nr:Ppx/GppA family phosphatase [Rhodospirillales bacterium]MCW9046277.1 Ppx/GppA family phosphatase [Alphaproteobacteria bacterium]